MSTLPKNSPYYKKFLNGDFGHAHAAQEFGVWAVLIGVSSYIPLLSLLVLVLLIIFLMPKADNYWLKREVRQSLKMGRKPQYKDETKVPDVPNKFWTQDAINDVKFPRKTRKLYPILGALYVGWALYSFGLFGIASMRVASLLGGIAQ